MTSVAQNMPSSFAGPDWRPMAVLPARANTYEESSTSYNNAIQYESAMPPQYQQNVPPPPYTPPQVAPTKRLRAYSPAVDGVNNLWQNHLPVTPSALSSSIAKQRMLWGVSPQSEKVDKRLDFGARTSPAPEDDYARGIISPRQARRDAAECDAFVQPTRPLGQKRRVSETGQGGRSREPSYSGTPNGDKLEDVFAAQERALQDTTSGFAYLRPTDVAANLFASAPADVADWMGQSSMEYVPQQSSQPIPPVTSVQHNEKAANADSPGTSPRSHRSNSTDAYDLVGTFSSGFVHGPAYENRVGNISGFAFGDAGPMGLMAAIRPVRSLSSSSQSAGGSPIDDNGDDESEKAMSQFFDFTSGSEESPQRFGSHAASPVEATA